MHRHVDRELTRARIAARAPAAHCDLEPVVTRVLSVIRRTPDGERLDWAVTVPAGLAARIDADDLTEALGALIENAARHARAGVTLAGRRTVDGVTLILSDDGPGIPEDRLTALLARGARLDTGGTGSGLGLSIAAEIVTASGGTLTLANRAGASGLEVTLTLPEARAHRAASA
jgi:signal transduction histidine kinase